MSDEKLEKICKTLIILACITGIVFIEGSVRGVLFLIIFMMLF